VYTFLVVVRNEWSCDAISTTFLRDVSLAANERNFWKSTIGLNVTHTAETMAPGKKPTKFIVNLFINQEKKRVRLLRLHFVNYEVRRARKIVRPITWLVASNRFNMAARRTGNVKFSKDFRLHYFKEFFVIFWSYKILRNVTCMAMNIWVWIFHIDMYLCIYMYIYIYIYIYIYTCLYEIFILIYIYTYMSLYEVFCRIRISQKIL